MKRFLNSHFVGFSASSCIFLIVIASFIGGNYFQEFISTTLGFFMLKGNYLLSIGMSIFLLLSLIVAFSPLGNLKLGGINSKPEFSTVSWITMMFSAGMGIGLLFFGVGEPLLHYHGNTPGIDPNSSSLTQDVIGLTLFHWTLHPWGGYSLVAILIGYFIKPNKVVYSFNAALKHSIGPKLYSEKLGKLVDILTILSIVIGVATSLGYGALQINAGLFHYFNIEKTSTMQFIIIFLISIGSTMSMLSGITNGVKKLSELNIIILFLLLVSIIIGYEQYDFLFSIYHSTLNYLGSLPQRSFSLSLINSAPEWFSDWTIFYWAWWISWSPFVGIFLARISLGRTIRIFILCALLVPSLFSIIWFSIIGTTALKLLDTLPELAIAVSAELTEGMFLFLDHVNNIPSILLGITALVSIILFFVTSSDSASIVVHNIASGEKKASNAQKIFWSLLEGALAAILLATGGLKSLQSFAIITSVPLCLCLLIIIGPFIKLLISDYKKNLKTMKVSKQYQAD